MPIYVPSLNKIIYYYYFYIITCITSYPTLIGLPQNIPHIKRILADLCPGSRPTGIKEVAAPYTMYAANTRHRPNID